MSRKNRRNAKNPPPPPPPEITDLRPVDKQSISPFDDTSWLVQVSEDEFLPICSFSSKDGAVVVLFLREVSLSRPEDASNDGFWAPWRDRAMSFLAFAAGEKNPVGAIQPCVLYRIKDGKVLPDTLASPLAAMKMASFPGLGHSILAMIHDLLSLEQKIKTQNKEISQVHHRAARLGVPHREVTTSRPRSVRRSR